MFNKMFRHDRSSRLAIPVAIILDFMEAMITLAMPLLLTQAIRNLEPRPNNTTPSSTPTSETSLHPLLGSHLLILVFAIAWFFNKVIDAGRVTLLSNVGRDVAKHQSNEIFDVFYRMPYYIRELGNPDEEAPEINGFTAAYIRIGAAINSLHTTTIPTALIMFSCLIATFTVEAFAGFISLITLVATVPVTALSMMRYTVKAQRALIEQESQSYAALLSGMNCVDDAIYTGTVEQEREKQNTIFSNLSSRYRDYKFAQSSANTIRNAVLGIGFISGIFYLLKKDDTKIDTILQYMFYMLEIVNSAAKFSQTLPDHFSALLDVREINQYTKTPLEDQIHTGSISLSAPAAPLVLANVKFSYPELQKRKAQITPSPTLAPGTQTVLEDVSVTFMTGTLTAISGASGLGKSTVLRLLFGMIQPTSGQITINNQTLSAYTLQSIRDNMAVVPQKHNVQPGTIKNNILYGCDGLTDEQVLQALRYACLDGIDINTNANRLSGGQKQRLALARVYAKYFTKQFKYLLLDEPTTGLDAPTARKVLSSLEDFIRNTGITAIAVTHELGLVCTLKVVSQVLMLHQGEVAELGTPAELMQNTRASVRAGADPGYTLFREYIEAYGSGLNTTPEPAETTPAAAAAATL